MHIELLLLRVVHILGGIFWLGSGLFTTFFLIPALGRTGAATAGSVMGALQQRRLFTVLPIVAVLTMLSGLRLLHIVSAGFDFAYLASRSGQTWVWSGVAASVAFVLSLVVVRPAVARTAQLAASLSSVASTEAPAMSAEIERLRRRSGNVSVVAMIFLIGAATGMATARYLG